MADTYPLTNADRDRAAQAKQVADANAQFAQLVADHAASPAARVERLRAELEALDADPFHMGKEISGNHAATSRRSALQASLKVAEAEAATELRDALTTEQRVDLAMAGQVDHNGIEVTVDGQLRAADFTAAVQDDLALGVPEAIVRSYYATGKSGDPLGHLAAEHWMTLFKSDAEMQRKFNAGDPVMRRRFRTASICLAGRHANVSPEDEAAEVARLRRVGRGDN